MSSTSSKKKFSFGKLLIWFVVIFAAINIFTDGALNDQLATLFEDNGSYQPGINQTPGYLGIVVSDKEGITGGYISAVKPGFSGAGSGLLPGDIVVSIGNKSINSYDDAVAELSAFHAGDTTSFTVLRNGQYVTLEIVFGEKPQENIPVSTGPQNSIPQQSIPSATTPVGTNPPVTNPPQVDIYPSVPEELRNHVYLNYRKWQHYRKLTGKVAITVIFVSNPEGSWSDGEISNVKNDLQSAVSRITSDAASYGAQVNISTHYKTVSTSVKIVDGKTDEWVKSALSAAGLPELNKLISGLESAYGVDSAPVFFVANHGGRAHAQPSYRYSVLYEDAHAFYHELSHLYGARDFYFPDDVEKLTETYIPNSIMVNSSEGVMEDFTAYLIGWTDSLTPNAMGFLQSTAYLTQEYLATEKEKDSYTGYVTDFPLGKGTYTGYLIDGMRHGQGKHIFEDGSVWEGTFVYGPLEGYGKIITESGNVMEGNFVKSSLHGQGTYTWASGAKYVGQWVNGKQSGQGTWTGNTGNTYTGGFLNGNFHGQGTYKWADGGSYTGGYDNGNRSGQGTMVYSDGSVYVGQWVDGMRSGQGKLTTATGNTYTGGFLNNTFHGQGTYKWATGGSYTGEYDNGNRSGQGIMVYSDGDIYDGQWLNDKRHGTGTYKWIEGSSYTGDFVENERTGQGTWTGATGNTYTGGFLNGNFHGQGTYKWINGTIQSGNWNNGKFTG